MKKTKTILRQLTLVSLLACAGTGVFAASPIPTFDKEDVTLHPYARTGEETIETPAAAGQELFRGGNTGAPGRPAFYVRRIRVDGEALTGDDAARLEEILSAYSRRSVETSELSKLREAVTRCYKEAGYMIAQTVIPPQEVLGGFLHLKVYTASYDKVTISNTSDVATSLFEKYAHNLHEGEPILVHELESALNNMNDLPAVSARAEIKPGSRPGTTSVAITAKRRPVWDNYIFADNGGSKFSGRWRTGFRTSMKNLGHTGDRLTVNGMVTEENTKNYGVRYDLPIGNDGTRWGVAWSQSSYDMATNPFYDSIGRSRGISFYGQTPLWRSKADRLTAIYGYDRRDIEDRQRMKSGLELTTEKNADVWHAGISGSQYAPGHFLQYSLIYWYGELSGVKTRLTGTSGAGLGWSGSPLEGSYHKLTGDFLAVNYGKNWNWRVKFSGQLANRALDGSEQFYLGGMNGVRAYGASDGYGDYGFLSTLEIRRATGVKHLEAALFLDYGAAGRKQASYYGRLDHLAGWGAGLRYEKNNDWYIHLDLARKINARRDRSEADDHSGRVWLQVYKMF